MFPLSALLEYDRVAIQCHDNPDPDALASAFAVHRYLELSGVAAEILYSGVAPISKANLRLMASALGIPLRFIERDGDHGVDEPPLLLTVDCQYGAGNVRPLPARDTAIIDHHVREAAAPQLCDIRPYLGSCSTLVWHMLRGEGFDFDAHGDVATALYYGLYTDTAALSEIVHPLDRDMRDSIRYDTGLIKRLRNSNLTMHDLTIAGKTLINHELSPETRSAVFEAEPCDPNILGFIGDLALQVDNIDSCVVFCRVSGGLKLSVRSCVREIMADELAARLCEGVGSGGGHKEKAGGFIALDKTDAHAGLTPMDFLRRRLRDYHGDYDLIYSDGFKAPPDMECFCKLAVPMGFVKTADVAPEGAQLIIRTLEGDTFATAGPDMYVVVGVKQEVYPIKREKFEVTYRETAGRYVHDGRLLPERHYPPTARDSTLGVTYELLPHARPCLPRKGAHIRAKELRRRTKVFTRWNTDGYMFGDAGDFLAVREDDPQDVYVIERDIFFHTYEKCAAPGGDI